MPETQLIPRYYPRLSTIVSVDKLPEILEFLKDDISDLLDKIYYKDLQHSLSLYGDTAFYNLSFVSKRTIGIDIPSTGLSLLLNPSLEGDNVSVFPVSLEYRLPILAYIKSFNLNTFSYTPEAFYKLALSVLKLSETQVIIHTINNITIPANDQVSRIEQFVNDVNTAYNSSISVPVGENQISLLAESIYSKLGVSSSTVVFNVYMDAFDLETSMYNIKVFFKSLLPDDVETFIKKLIVPDVSFLIEDIRLGLAFPRNMLKPVYVNNVEGSDNYENRNKLIGEDVDWDGTLLTNPLSGEDLENIKSKLIFDVGRLKFSTENGLEFENESNFSFQKSQIGNTGITLYFENMKLDLSRTRNIPEAIADGRPDDFMGVFVETAEIGLPAKWFAEPESPQTDAPAIVGKNLIIGTGGISGTIGFDAAGTLHKKLGDFDISLDAFDVTFQQNAITESNIFGKLKINGFKDVDDNDAEIDINVNFDVDGNFTITGRETEGIAIKIPDVFEIILKEVAIGKKDNLFFLDITGNLKIINTNLSNIFKAAIDIKGLIIWSDGRIELKGGGIQLPQAVTAKFGATEISITAIHYGSHEQTLAGAMRKYNYFGFDGGVSVNPGGVDAKGTGVKFYFTVDGGTFDCFLRIESISIDLIIPGNVSPDKATVLISGYLSMKGPSDEDANAPEEYIGSVSVSLPQMGDTGLSITAAMRMAPKVPAYLVDLDLELPTSIPLGPTGLGIYGFRGLLGQRYVASKEEVGVDTWWEYYKAKIDPDYEEGIQVSKFAQAPGFSVGAGMTLATAADSGKAFSSKLFIMLQPDLFLLEGQAQLLKKRIGLDTSADPPFSLIIVVSEESVLADFDINFKTPETDGKIFKLSAHTSMGFFYHDSSAWYVNIGTKDNPNSAKVFSIFTMESYLMLSASGIMAGASTSTHISKKLGPLKASLDIYMSIEGKLNYVPAQIGATLLLGGALELSLWGVGLELSIDTSIAAEVSHPFYINGKVKGCIKVLKKKKCISFDYKWVKDQQINVTEIELHLPAKGAAACNIATNEIFPIKRLSTSVMVTTGVNTAVPPEEISEIIPAPGTVEDLYVIPLDSVIKFEFLKPVASSETLKNKVRFISGTGNTVKVPKKKGKLDQVEHTFMVEDVQIKQWQNGAWQNYNIYDELYPEEQDIDVIRPTGNYIGSWQLDKSGKKVTQLWILGTDPLEWMRNSNQIPDLSAFNISSSDLLCEGSSELEVCMNFDESENAIIPVDTENFNKTSYRLSGNDGIVDVFNNPFGHSKGLAVASEGKIEILFNEPVTKLSLQLHSTNLNTKISYYKREESGTDVDGISTYDFSFVTASSYSIEDTVSPITYYSETVPIDKIVIETGACDSSGSGTSCEGLNQEAIDFQILLNALVAEDMLTNQIEWNPDCELTREPISSYYSDLLRSYIVFDISTVHYYWVDIDTPNTLNAIITIKPYGDNDPIVNFTLSFREGDTIYDFNDIVSFEDIQINLEEAVPGDNHNFYITAVMNDGSRQMLHGTADYVIAPCSSNLVVTPQRQLDALTSEQNAIQEEIDLLTAKIERLSNTDSACNIMLSQLNDQLDNLRIGQGAMTIISSTPTTDDGSPWCGIVLFGCCWLTKSNYSYQSSYADQFDISANNLSMVQAINNSFRPVWKPGTTYAIQLKTSDKVRNVTKNTTVKTYTNYFNYVFRTEGPPGHFHKFTNGNLHPKYASLVDDGNEDEFKLAKLQNYINFSRSYPNADGNILNAKPLFYRNPELLLVFSEAHAYTMYGVFNDTYLKIAIKDPLKPDITELAEITWEKNSYPIPSANTQVLNNLIENGMNCSELTEAQPIGSQIKYTVSFLEPLKLYTAVIISHYNAEDEKVHSFPFQTSRYACFREQVESFMTIEGTYTPCVVCTEPALADYTVKAKAFYDIVKYYDTTELQADIVNAQSIVQGTLNTGNLITQFSHKFDRIINGALKLEELAPALATEFNMIVDGSTSTVLGILVRNPEPFNDPKIPVSTLETTIQVVDSDDSERAEIVPGYIAIFSKDAAKVLITNDNLAINEPQLYLRFRYLEYNQNTEQYELKCAVNNEVFVKVDVTVPTTRLMDDFINAQEVELDAILEAIPVESATAYEFRIVGGDIDYIYLRNSNDALFPLYEVPDLAYNKTYEVSVRPIISGRNTVFGESCTIATKNITFVINAPSTGIKGVPVTVKIEARGANTRGSIQRDYNGAVTLETSGSATGEGLVNIINGIGTAEINDSVAETVTLSLIDTENTGITLGTEKTILFEEPQAVEIVIDTIGNAIQGSPLEIALKVLLNTGNLADTYNGTVDIELTGSAVADTYTVNFINGIASIIINDDVYETIALSFVAGSTTLNIPAPIEITFMQQPASKFVIIDPANVPEETNAEVTIEAWNSYNQRDLNFNTDVTLVATGSISGAISLIGNGLVDMNNGIGTISVYSDIAQMVTLTLQDTENTGLQYQDAYAEMFFVTVLGVGFEDSFTETEGITLAEHTPDVGMQWIKLIQINLGTLKVDPVDDALITGSGEENSGVLYVADTGYDYQGADYQVEIRIINNGKKENPVFLAARVLDENNMYAVKLTKEETALYKKIDGAWYSIATTGAVADGSIVKFSVTGNILSVADDFNGEILNYSDSSITEAGKAGIGMGALINLDDDLANQIVDSFAIRFGSELDRIFLDRFSTDGLLENIIPEQGNGWQKISSVGLSEGIRIKNGTAVIAARSKKLDSGSFYVADTNYSKADYEAALTVIRGETGEGTIILGVRVENNGNDGYFVRFNNSLCRLYKRIAGVWTMLGDNDGAGVANGSRVRLRIVDDKLDFLINSRVELTETVTDITEIGKAGFGFGAVIEEKDDELKQEVDDFVVRII